MSAGDQLDALEAEAVEAAPVVRPGATRPGETRYFVMPDGTIATRTLSAGTDYGATIPAPEGGREIDAEHGADYLATFRTLAEQARQDARHLAALQRAQAYDALVALGLAASHAALIAGHTPPALDAPPAGTDPAG